MLVSMNPLLEHAQKNHTIVPAFNVYNLETIQAVARGAKAAGCPVIFAVGESYLDHISPEMAFAMVHQAAQEHGLLCALHLDHAKKADSIERVLGAGFTSVMFDGSRFSLQQNIQLTAQMAQKAHAAGASIEGELGYMNPEDGSGEQLVAEQTHTLPQDAAEFVRRTGADALAVAVGNAHGVYHSKPQLNLPRIQEIFRSTGVPLVLHGASGIPMEQLQLAAARGVQKINVNTELALTGASAILQLGAAQPSLRLEKAMRAACEAMEQVVTQLCAALCVPNGRPEQ